MVIGVGIFKAPSIVAGNTSSSAEFLFAWLLGGVISLCGALVYAELVGAPSGDRRRVRVPARAASAAASRSCSPGRA